MGTHPFIYLHIATWLIVQKAQIVRSVQDSGISGALAVEISQSCTWTWRSWICNYIPWCSVECNYLSMPSFLHAFICIQSCRLTWVHVCILKFIWVTAWERPSFELLDQLVTILSVHPEFHCLMGGQAFCYDLIPRCNELLERSFSSIANSLYQCTQQVLLKYICTDVT